MTYKLRLDRAAIQYRWTAQSVPRAGCVAPRGYAVSLSGWLRYSVWQDELASSVLQIKLASGHDNDENGGVLVRANNHYQRRSSG